MKLIRINSENIDMAFDYWKKIGKGVPYFFETTKHAFARSLLNDTFNGAKIFNEHYIFAAVEDGSMQGLIQYGLPCFYFAGGAEMKFIEDYTEIESAKILYLVWIYVAPEVKGQGIATEFMKNIQNYYLSQGYRIMHTDTAINNKVAQKYYERNGFRNLGITSSFQRSTT